MGHGHHGDLRSSHTAGWGAVRALWCRRRSCVTSHVPWLSKVPAALHASSIWPRCMLASFWYHRHPPLSSQMCKKREKRLPDPTLEKYVLTVVLDTINAFFSSPFSENSTSLQVMRCCMAKLWPGKKRGSLRHPKARSGHTLH